MLVTDTKANISAMVLIGNESLTAATASRIWARSGLSAASPRAEITASWHASDTASATRGIVGRYWGWPRNDTGSRFSS